MKNCRYDSVYYLEPVQGSGGVNLPPKGYFQKIQKFVMKMISYLFSTRLFVGLAVSERILELNNLVSLLILSLRWQKV